MLNINGTLRLKDFYNVAIHSETVALNTNTLTKVKQSHEFLIEFAKNKVIYGVNTGFGPMAQYKIEASKTKALQYNLIRSHASGTGEVLENVCVRASLLARLNTLSLGNSGIHKSVLEVMLTLLNKDILPLVFHHGGVGASGDLVQLAHMALVLIGEGEVFYKGKRLDTKTVFKTENIKPIEVVLREGLGLINGTSVMTGIGMINLINAKKIIAISTQCSSAINELVQAYDDHLSLELNNAKKHNGQAEIASQMRAHLSDSKLIKHRAQHLYTANEDVEVFHDKVQEYYSIRCVPQILGPVLDTINQAEMVLVNEVNSANDNPIVDVKNQNVFHGGNFHGDYVSLEMDKLKLVMTKTSMLAERQINYLLNSKLNNLLPPFVNLGQLGLNFGMQGVQFTATSTTAENQTLSNSMYVHSIPNNNDNQDVVSMGTNSALMTKKVIENTFEVLAIEVITITQAIEYLKVQDKLSSKTLQIYKDIRAIVPVFKEDLVMYPYIQQVKDYLINTKIEL
jgi:histidine ammonia-lyase